ncbi:MAG: metallophosphoesterase [Treponema sp.]|nr:metallophosphoesterase [Treponema sp.]
MRYCCSDLHDCFDEFMALLKRIGFTNNDTMYISGDIIDGSGTLYFVLRQVQCRQL